MMHVSMSMIIVTDHAWILKLILPNLQKLLVEVRHDEELNPTPVGAYRQAADAPVGEVKPVGSAHPRAP